MCKCSAPFDSSAGRVENCRCARVSQKQRCPVTLASQLHLYEGEHRGAVPQRQQNV